MVSDTSRRKSGRAKATFKRDAPREKHTIGVTGSIWKAGARHARTIEGVKSCSELFSRVVEILNGARGTEEQESALRAALERPTRKEMIEASAAAAFEKR